MIYGAVLNVYTDYKNLTFQTSLQQCVICWCLFLEDYDVTFGYIEGEKNVLVDCFSRLPCMSKPLLEGNKIEKKGTKNTM